MGSGCGSRAQHVRSHQHDTALGDEEVLGISHGILADVHFAPGAVDFANATRFKDWLLDRAWQAFGHGAGRSLRAAFEQFKSAEVHWLDEYALFMAIKAAQGGRSWQSWPSDLLRREPAALERVFPTWAAARSRTSSSAAPRRTSPASPTRSSFHSGSRSGP